MKQLLFAIIVLFAISSYGQDELQIEDRRLAADKVFGALSPDVYGGRLLDRTFSDFEPTLQQRRGNYQQIHNAYTFVGLYSDLALSYVDPNAMLDNEKLVRVIDQTFGRYEMESEEDLLVQPFGLLLHNLKQIDSSYYDSTYFTSQNYQFIPKVNEKLLYKDVQIKSAALLEFYGDNGYTEGTLKYNEAFISTSPDIRIIQIKLDVGRGFENFGPSNPELTYSRMGDYIEGRAALRYYLKDSIVSDTLTFHLTTIGEKNDQPKGRDGWDDKGTYTGAYGIDLRWGIKYGCGHREGLVRRPFIIAPPYRPKLQLISLQKYYDQFNFKSMISSLTDMGYDVIFLKEKPGNGSIEEAGKTIADFIVAVNATKKMNFPNEDWENIVMGFSAGGQHMRYALKYLEKRHMDWNTPHHHTRLYIPFDSPHLGANIPMFTQTVYLDKKGMNVFAMLANNSLVDEGSKDMAVTHYYGSNVSQVGNSNVYMIYPGPCSERQNLVNALNNDFNHQFTPLNDLRRSFPSFTRNVSIATGRSDINYRAEYGLQPGMLLFSQDNVGFGIGGLQYKNRKLYASKYGASPTVFRNLEKILTFLFPITIRNRDYRTAYANEWDLAQGGHKDEFYTGYAVGVVPIGAVPILRSGFFGGQQFYFNHVSFMPVVSALAINPTLWQNNQLLYNLKTKGLMYKSVQDYTNGITSNTYGYPNLAHPSTHFSITPFESVYADVQTYEHIKMQESVDNDGLDDVYLVHTRNFILDEVEADINCLQNQVVGNNHNQWASGYKYRAWYRAYDKIMIGYNVTPKTDPGDYVIKKTGVITVHAGKEVNIKPGFHAQSGSDFYAFIEYSCSRPRSKSMENDDDISDVQESENVPEAEIIMRSDENMMLVFPNPASGNFTVRVSENYIGGIYSICDLYGKEILKGNIRALDNQVDARLSKGVYLIRVTNNGNVKTQKIVID